MAKILLVDADSKNGFPNLALMKLSAHHKNNGDHVDLIKGIPSTAPLRPYDKTFISCIFPQNKAAVIDYASQIKNSIIGGSGLDYSIRLDDDIEHILPDYSLYGVNFSMGFTSRGCIRKCEFCIVPEKEGPIHDHAPITEFLHPDHDKVILLDNNFQASPKWRENVEFLLANDLKVNFNQGLDIRLINEAFAAYLAELKTYSWHFKNKGRGFHVALDDPKTTAAFLRGMDVLENAGVSPSYVMVYVLVGFNTTYQEDVERVFTILERGAKPYVMRYNGSKKQPQRHLARWINRRYYEFVDFGSYNNGVLVEGAE